MTATTASAATCDACSASVAPGDRFCEACGHQLGAAPAPTATAAAAGGATACRSCGAVGSFVDGWCSSCGLKQPARRDHLELELLEVGVAGVTNKGRRHHRNEDAMAALAGDGFVVAVVCDGVSTTVRPDDASQGAADAAAAVLLAAGPAAPDHGHAYDAARAAVIAVDFVPHPDLGPPSCTYLAAVVTDAAISLAALGDCRAYWVDDTVARQLTVDDSWATAQVQEGLMSSAEAYADPRAHAITAWLGRDADPAWVPALVEFVPPGPGRLLLVSDGLWNYAHEPADVARAMQAGDDLAALPSARRLIDFANAAGGADNITAVIVDLPLPKGSAPA